MSAPPEWNKGGCDAAGQRSGCPEPVGARVERTACIGSGGKYRRYGGSLPVAARGGCGVTTEGSGSAGMPGAGSVAFRGAVYGEPGTWASASATAQGSCFQRSQSGSILS